MAFRKKNKEEKTDKSSDNKKEKSFTKIRNWYQDRYESVVIQRNFLVICVVAMIITFGFVIVGVIELNNTKVYEPFIVQVEESTGIITKVNNSQVRDLPAEKAMRNSSLVRYIFARETYNYADYEFSYYQIVRLLSDPQVYSQFLTMIDTNNPESPISNGFQYKVDLKIKTMIDLDESQNLVQIRVSKARLPATTVRSDEVFEKNAKNYIITLKYEYRDLSLSETERYINPLGMQITAYSINEEINAKNI